MNRGKEEQREHIQRVEQFHDGTVHMRRRDEAYGMARTPD